MVPTTLVAYRTSKHLKMSFGVLVPKMAFKFRHNYKAKVKREFPFLVGLKSSNA